MVPNVICQYKFILLIVLLLLFTSAFALHLMLRLLKARESYASDEAFNNDTHITVKTMHGAIFIFGVTVLLAILFLIIVARKLNQNKN